MLQQTCRCPGNRALALYRPPGPQCRKMTGQLNIGPDRQKGQQVKLLEDKTGVITPETVPGGPGQFLQRHSQQPDTASPSLMHPAQQAQQGRLAAATGTLQEQGLTRRQAERWNIQQLRLAGPGKTQILKLKYHRHGRSP